MLWHILAATRELAADVQVVFANTGKEREETLEFVQECSKRWRVPIHWLEFRPGSFQEVNFEIASRHGEPFAALIKSKQYLPNPLTRFCTIELKIRTFKRYALSLGWKHWTNVIGLRADEMHRVEKLQKRSRERWKTIAPMAAAGAAEADVLAFWRRQPFDLKLKRHEGNCDLCYLKGAGKISAILRDRPELADWWIAREKELGKTFRIDRPSYAQMLDGVRRQREFNFGIFDDLETCSSNACTD